MVESLIAVALLAIGAAVVGTFMTSQIRHAAVSHLSSQAYSLAADEMERIRALPWPRIANAQRAESVGGVEFTVRAEVDGDVPARNMKSITVAVEWSEPGGPKYVDIHSVYTQVTPE